MKLLSQQLRAEKAKAEVISFYLVKLDTYCYTDCDVSIMYNGDTYMPLPLQLQDFQSSADMALEGGNIRLGNVDLVVSSLILNNLLKNKNVTIYEAFFDSNNTIIDVDTIFVGRIEGQTIDDEYWATIYVSAYRYNQKTYIPNRRINRTCGWMFKDADCNYSGSETWCSKTWQRCVELNNNARFGGFRFIPVRGTKFTWKGIIIEVK